jgi:tRNA(His) 5'-end guanylyltransferase
MKDDLGKRIKENYEMRTRTYLPRRTYTILRLDGCGFSKYTRGLDRPYDAGLIEDMNNTAVYLCEKIQGAQFAYVQSDEISILLTDFDKTTTSSWFDGQTQKITSVSAAMATAKFNELRSRRTIHEFMIAGSSLEAAMSKVKLAYFDSRAFTIPDPIEVANYFLWRQKDCVRNSITMAAQSVYSHTELEGINSNEKQEMLFQKGINWNDYPTRYKRGGFITRVEREMVMTDFAGIIPLDSVVEEGDEKSKEKFRGDKKTFFRQNWECVELPEFSKDQNFLYSRIPIVASEIISLADMLQMTSGVYIAEEVDGGNHLS